VPLSELQPGDLLGLPEKIGPKTTEEIDKAYKQTDGYQQRVAQAKRNDWWDKMLHT